MLENLLYGKELQSIMTSEPLYIIKPFHYPYLHILKSKEK